MLKGEGKYDILEKIFIIFFIFLWRIIKDMKKINTPKENEESKKTINPYIVVKSSDIHNKGIFARKDIAEGTLIIEYVGEKITKKESERRAEIVLNKSKDDETHGAVYLFELNKRYDIDGNVEYNTARYINHSCDPNCETENRRGHIWIVALRDIEKGEELSYNYGYGYEDYEEHICRCNSDKCIGYILAEEHWPKLKRKLKRKKQ